MPPKVNFSQLNPAASVRNFGIKTNAATPSKINNQFGDKIRISSFVV